MPRTAAAATGLGSVLTLGGVIVAWVFFRAEGVGTAFDLLHALAGATAPEGGMLPSYGTSRWIGLALLFLAVARWLPNSQQLMEQLRLWYARRPRPAILAATIGALASLVLLIAAISESRNVAEFIYFNF
jgi:hypothetical protein